MCFLSRQFCLRLAILSAVFWREEPALSLPKGSCICLAARCCLKDPTRAKG